MTQVAFETLAYAKKLKAAGLDSKIAEVQAEVQVEMLEVVWLNICNCAQRNFYHRNSHKVFCTLR